MNRRTLFLGAATLAAFGVGVSAHVRILHPQTLAPLRWTAPAGIGIAISPVGPAELQDGSHVTALQSAIEAWNATPGSGAQLIEGPATEQSDWESDAIHLITFDEANDSGYFPTGSSTVAITPIWFFSNGAISDADVLFNAGGYQWSTDGSPGTFDVGDVATHELGHLLGLDHTGFAGATMYPYVDATGVLHRSLSIDDVNGIRDAYPGQSFAQFTGTITDASDQPVFGAHLVARDAAGRVRGATITDAAGAYQFNGLDPATYTIYATPLDAPVSGQNLTGQPDLDTDFRPTDVPGTHTATAGTVVDLGNLQVLADSDLQLGRSTDSLPLRGILGQETTLSLRGAGLDLGSTLTCSDPDITVTPVNWLGSFVSFRLDVPVGEELGHVDLTVTNPAGERAILAGGVELTPPDPIVGQVAPASGSFSGGTALQIDGQNFRTGCRVVIGDRIYVDGEPGGATVVSSTRITLTTAAMVPGLHDVVVIDESGIEGRGTGAFQAALQPQIASIFPTVGTNAGGTEVTLTGEEFADGLEVRIDGVLQPTATVIDVTEVRFDTAGGTTGGPYELTLTNPGGAEASASFSYTSAADPELMEVDPPFGIAAGGDTVTLRGANFATDATVLFGVDPQTGQGGTLASGVTRVDDGTIEVETPAGSGVQAVLVRNVDTGQADVLEGAFQFQGESGGGGCTTVLVSGDGPDGRAGSLLAWGLAAAACGLASWSAGRGLGRAQPRRSHTV